MVSIVSIIVSLIMTCAGLSCPLFSGLGPPCRRAALQKKKLLIEALCIYYTNFCEEDQDLAVAVCNGLATTVQLPVKCEKAYLQAPIVYTLANGAQ